MRQQMRLQLAVCCLLVPNMSLAAEFFGIGVSGAKFEGLSADGTTIIGSTLDPAPREAFRWTRSAGIQPLGDLPGGEFRSAAGDVSADGQVVVGASIVQGSISGAFVADVFRWTRDNGMVGIGTASNEAETASISEDGSTIAFTIPSDRVLVRWTINGLQMFPTPDVVLDAGVNLSANGDKIIAPSGLFWTEDDGLTILSNIIGFPESQGVAFYDGGKGLLINAGDAALLWHEDAGVTEFPTVGGRFVSEDGSVVAGFSDDDLAWVWHADSGLEFLPIPVEVDKLIPSAMSVDGDTLLLRGQGFIPGSVESDVYVWDRTSGSRRLLDALASEYELADEVAGWQFNERDFAISDDGLTLAGEGTNPRGETEFWIADLRPAPPTLAGDYNNNGLVEQADLDLVLLHWGSDASNVPPTWINDLPTGAIDQDELDKVLLGWGSSVNNMAMTAAIPEPTSLTILGMALLLLIFRTPRRKTE